jgi:polar amino acid transport system permease protein
MQGVLADVTNSLGRGAVVTVEVTLLAAVLALTVAFVMGLCRLSRNPLVRAAATVYVEVMRGVSALVVMFWMYFALPLLGIQLTALEAGVLGLGLTYGAYAAEVLRGAVLHVPRSQWEGALALNMTPAQRMVRVILPQAAVAMLPPMGNLLVDLLKATSLVSLITLADLTFQARVLQNSIGRPTEIFLAVLAMYFVMNYALTLGLRQLEARFSRGLDIGRGARVTVTVT